jgi:hypothetical protein
MDFVVRVAAHDLALQLPDASHAIDQIVVPLGGLRARADWNHDDPKRDEQE